MANIGSMVLSLVAETSAFRRDVNRATETLNSNTAKMQRSLKQVQRESRNVRRSFDQLRAGAAALAGALAVRQFTQFTAGAIKTSAAIQDVSDKIGVNVEQLQQLQFAANQVGVATTQLNTGLQRFSRRVGEVAQGQGELLKVANQYGIELRDNQGRMRESVDILGDFADVVSNAESSQERLRIAFKLFDSEGAALVNILQEGRQGLERFMQQAQAVGAVMDASLVRRAKEASDNLTTLERVFATAFNTSIIESFASSVTASTENLRTARQVGEDFGRIVGASMRGVAEAARFVADNLQLISRALSALIAFQAARLFGNIAFAVGKLVTSLAAAATAAGGLTAAIRALTVALARNPITLLATAAAALAANFIVLRDRTDDVRRSSVSYNQAIEAGNTITGTAVEQARRLAFQRKEEAIETVQAALAEEKLTQARANTARLRQFEVLERLQKVQETGRDVSDTIQRVSDNFVRLGEISDRSSARIRKLKDTLEDLKRVTIDIGGGAAGQGSGTGGAVGAATDELTELGKRALAITGNIKELREAAARNKDTVEENTTAVKELREQASILEEPFRNALEGIQRGFSDAFTDIFRNGISSFGTLADRIKDVFARLAGEIAALLVFRPVVGGILGGAGLGGIASQLGVGGTGFGDILSLGQNFGGGGVLGALNSVSLGGLFSTATTQGATGLAAGVGGVGPAFVENAVAAQTGLLPTSFGSFLGGAGLGFGAGSLLNSLVGGNQLGGTIGSGLGGAAGAAIGSIVPGVGTLVGGLIGGSLGGVFGGLFGGGGDQSDTIRLKTSPGVPRRGVEDNVSAQGPFGVITNRNFSENLSKNVVQKIVQGVAKFDEAIAQVLDARQNLAVTEFLRGASKRFSVGVDSFPAGRILKFRGRRILDALGLSGRGILSGTRDPQGIAGRIGEAVNIQRLIEGPSTVAEQTALAVQQVTNRFDDMIAKAREWGFEVDKLIERRDQEIELIRQGSQLGINVRQSFGQAGQNILSFLNAENFAGTSPLSPAQRLTEAQRQFRDILERVRGGDAGSTQALLGSAGQLLNVAQNQFASTVDFQNIRSFVRSQLASVGEEFTSEDFLQERITEAIRQQTLSQEDQTSALLEANNEIRDELRLLNQKLSDAA